jgi:hypothetical protein
MMQSKIGNNNIQHEWMTCDDRRPIFQRTVSVSDIIYAYTARIINIYR